MASVAVSRADLRSSFAWCEHVARKQAGNFYPAFRLLPQNQRLAMCALYAFMRVTDDLVDEPGHDANQRAELESWRQRFLNALDGQCSHPLHAAIVDSIRRFSIPIAYFNDALDGAAMDLGPVRFETFNDLYRYCYCVASTVGLACIHIWGFQDESAKRLAEQAGIAFQLTNILRDLREDAARGRMYLPREDLIRFQCSPDRLGRTDDPAYRNLMAHEVQLARDCYEASEPLPVLLQRPGAAVFRAMHSIYRRILEEIEKRNYDVYSSRVGLNRWTKWWLVMKSLPTRWGLAT